MSGEASGAAPWRCEPPFGAHALPARLERLRALPARLGRGALARRLASVVRRICQSGRADPFDVEPFPGQRARLYPRDNLTEKRVFAAPHLWDRAEREALAEAMAAAPRPFHFVDAGANAGLYTLAVRSMGRARILAIEPEPATRARLEVNLAASGAGADEVTVAPVALSDRAGTARIAAIPGNRGEAALALAGAEVETVPLLDLLGAHGFSRVDALKIDIEGHEHAVLSAFLAAAPAALLPGLVILEARRGAETDALALLRGHGYEVAGRTKMNAILSRVGPPGARRPKAATKPDGPDGKA